MSAVIQCEGVSKRYGEVLAVNEVSLAVEEGEIFGLLGPNGAGKTTLIEMMESLRPPDDGTLRVLGLDPQSEAVALRERIGIQLQATSVQPNIKVREAVEVFAGLYQKQVDDPAGLLTQLSLQDKAESRYKTLSGGQKQRVAIALALVNDPELLFFDEISTGLDPQARRSMWQLIKDIRAGGKTVFMTTHYMEEAEELCDRVAILDGGRIIALDTPQKLIKQLGADFKIDFGLKEGELAEADLLALPDVVRVERSGNEGEDNAYCLYTTDDSAALTALVHLADEKGVKLSELRTEQPTLDDVFLTLTGRGLRE